MNFYDKEEAPREVDIEVLKKSAEAGDSQAQYNLAISYYRGQGVEKDKAEAVRWFRKAAEQGHSKAQFVLAWCYCQGDGIEEDEEEASKWLIKAANQRNETAADLLNIVLMLL
ncbi:MAG: sel1 repeat family protein [Candidatus Hydrogenedens sp.]|nr:sel1 repeat family protein [Candidatus Hydrogenedens sp.]